jgi:hypothetical protein
MLKLRQSHNVTISLVFRGTLRRYRVEAWLPLQVSSLEPLDAFI